MVLVIYDMFVGGVGCGDGFGVVVDILLLVVIKSIFNLQFEYEFGDVVMYVLCFDIFLGDVQDIIFEDFFFLFVIDLIMLDINLVIGSGGVGENQDICFGLNYILGIGYQLVILVFCILVIEIFVVMNLVCICWFDIFIIIV